MPYTVQVLATRNKAEAEDLRAGITLDQVLARAIGQDTPLPSLELATEDFAGYVGGCVPGYACSYMSTISWASATASVPMAAGKRRVKLTITR